MKNKKYISGYTMVELLLSVFVGSIVIAGAYASYMVIAIQFDRNSGQSEISDLAIPTVKILEKNLRMTGFRYVNDDIESTWGAISTPITITDSGSVCCDSFNIIYDTVVGTTATRKRFNYYISARSNPTRNALYMDVEEWDGSSWTTTDTAILVSDYIEDFQIEGESNNDAGFPTLIHLNMTFRSRYKTSSSSTFTKSDFGTGNRSFSITDNYQREEFETSIRLRNLIDNN